MFSHIAHIYKPKLMDVCGETPDFPIVLHVIAVFGPSYYLLPRDC